MKKNWGVLLCIFTFLFTPPAHCAKEEEKKLYIYGWANNIAPAVLQQFEKETGIKVTFDVFDSDEILEAKLLMGKTGYDITTPSNTYFARQAKLGLYQPLNKAKLSNLKHLSPHILNMLQSIDTNNTYGLPLTWGTVGYGYNVQKIQEKLGRNAQIKDLILDPKNAEKLASCGIVLLDLPHDVIEGALYYLKTKNPEALHDKDVNKAMKQLTKIRPHIKRFNNSPDQAVTDLLEEEACIVQSFSGDILRAKAEAKAAGKPFEIAYTIPPEGTNGWIDVLAIPRDAKHPNNAHAFLNFLMRPEVALQNAIYSRQATPNIKAQKLLPKAIKNDPATYPDAKTMARIHLPLPRPLHQERTLTRRWYKFKLGI